MIDNFRGKYEFLSNFYGVAPTVEHFFQAEKTLIDWKKRQILRAPTPGAARRMGRHVPIRSDWEQIKEDSMLRLLRRKFSHPELRALLLATGDEELIEGNTWGDEYWGCVWRNGGWVGQNKLGKLLMRVRGEIRDTVIDDVSLKRVLSSSATERG